MEKIKSKLKCLFPGVYLVTYKDYFDMAISFLRMQEYYENPSKKFKNKIFNVLDFMQHYVRQTKKPYFTYPDDYCGYNIPSSVIYEFNLLDGSKLNEFEIDLFMHIDKIKKFKNHEDFYLIACHEKDKNVLKHEIAHGLYFTDPIYKTEMQSLGGSLPKKLRKKIFKVLTEMKYHDSVHYDELQAYMATGLSHELEKIKGIKKHRKYFKKVFKKYYKSI